MKNKNPIQPKKKAEEAMNSTVYVQSNKAENSNWWSIKIKTQMETIVHFFVKQSLGTILFSIFTSYHIRNKKKSAGRTVQFTPSHLSVDLDTFVRQIIVQIKWLH